MTGKTSSEMCVSRETEFFVKNVPSNFIDWDLFNIFKRFGIVHNVRIPNNSNHPFKFAFVTMGNLNAADEVRAELGPKRQLIAENKNGEKIALEVNDIREDNGGPSTSKGVPAKAPVSNHERRQEGGDRDRGRIPKTKELEVSTRMNAFWKIGIWPGDDLQLHKAVKVSIVDAPKVDYENGTPVFTFYVTIQDNLRRKHYESMQLQLNSFCKTGQCLINNPDSIPVGGFCLFVENEIGFRAIRLNEHEIYLCDFGRKTSFIPGQIFALEKRFQHLPALVIKCSVFGVRWLQAVTETDVNNYREVAKQWGTDASLSVKCKAFQHDRNVVSLYSDEGELNDFSAALIRKGKCEAQELLAQRYSRSEIYAIRDKVADARPDVSDDLVELFQGMQTK